MSQERSVVKRRGSDQWVLYNQKHTAPPHHDIFIGLSRTHLMPKIE